MLRNKKNRTKKLVLFYFIIILDLTFLYFIKYKNQSLSFNEFNLSNIGNTINLIVYIIFLTGFTIINFSKNQFWDRKNFIFVFIIVSYLSSQLILVR